MRYEGETGNVPWDNEGPVRPALRPVRNYTNRGASPVVTDLPVPTSPVPCGDSDAELWVGGSEMNALYAARLCKFCRLRPDCEEYGIEHPAETGVWGGLTQDQRKKRHAFRYPQALQA